MGKGSKDSKTGRGGGKGENGKSRHEESKGKGKDGKKGTGKAKKGDGERTRGEQHWVPKDSSREASSFSQQLPTGRSPLSSSAPDFKPIGLFGDLNAMGSFWNWPTGQEIQMPQIWREYADKDGSKYYYNSKTGLSQWERPQELGAPEPTPADEKSRGSLPSTAPRLDNESTPADDYSKSRSAEGGGKSEGKGGKSNRRRQKPDGHGKEREVSFGSPGCNLFVFHLPDDWADEDLLEYFAPHGNVTSAKVMKELGTGRSRGFGFVSYEDRTGAATAVKKMQGYKVLGKRLKVEFKKGEGENAADGDGDDMAEGNSRNTGEDERLIGYLRAISAQTVVQSLKESDVAAEGSES
eukprot:TRINITY_DN62905_c0_g1_i1.p1 TRINITY_DN62905_c0_g1~~TRINITY_DN62905_c0_g1_i1.p1  ORF type:complete len:352 (-),score=83.78 TRINITY_DN62905_c0_g1_i1:30-1085(-)